MSTFFGSRKNKFPSIPEDGMVQTIPVLLAAKDLLPFFDMFGTAFKLIRGDIEGNVKKLQRKYDNNPEKFVTFHAMLTEEKEISEMRNDKSNRHKESATIALLWLKRALEYMLILITSMLDDHRKGCLDESMVPYCRKAYEEALKKYHSWLIQKLFGVVAHACPYTKDIVKALAYDKDTEEAVRQTFTDMEDFCKELDAHVTVIGKMLKDMDLDFQDRV